MIADYHIEAARSEIPWKEAFMVEQDMIITKALIEIYNDGYLKNNLIFRGGTAINKLYLKPPQRYSEDIDFVQYKQAPIGASIEGLRKLLSPWLGPPRYKLTQRGIKFLYQYNNVEGDKSKLKIEINTTEHFHAEPLGEINIQMQSAWFNGSSLAATYSLEELMATKLRALYQRRKGRDLFDVWHVFSQGMVRPQKVVEIFHRYAEYNKEPISAKAFLNSMQQKYNHMGFRDDMDILLPPKTSWDFEEAFLFVKENVLPLI